MPPKKKLSLATRSWFVCLMPAAMVLSIVTLLAVATPLEATPILIEDWSQNAPAELVGDSTASGGELFFESRSYVDGVLGAVDRQVSSGFSQQGSRFVLTEAFTDYSVLPQVFRVNIHASDSNHTHWFAIEYLFRDPVDLTANGLNDRLEILVPNFSSEGLSPNQFQLYVRLNTLEELFVFAGGVNRIPLSAFSSFSSVSEVQHLLFEFSIIGNQNQNGFLQFGIETISAVPEPSALGMLAMAGAALGGGYLRRGFGPRASSVRRSRMRTLG